MPSLNVRDYLLAGACGLALLCAGLLGVQSWRLSRAEEATKAAQARELGAKVQVRLSDKVLKIEEHRHTIETRIEETAHEAAADVRSAPSGSAALDLGLRDRWLAGIERVRAASQPATDDPGSGEPAPTVSAP